MPQTRSGRSTSRASPSSPPRRRRAAKSSTVASNGDDAVQSDRCEASDTQVQRSESDQHSPPVQKLFINEIGQHSVVHHWNHLSTYRISRLTAHSQQSVASTHAPWPTTTDIACWHCTEPFTTQPIGIPVECGEQEILCDGNFCSYSCALAYIFHSRASHREYNAKQLLCQVAREVHGIANVRPAPPMLLLDKFGGPLTIDEFRNTTEVHSVVPNPPFARADVVYESTREHEGGGEPVTAAADADAAVDSTICGLRVPASPLCTDQFLAPSEPLGPPLMEQFVASHSSTNGSDGGFGGDLGAFIKRSDGGS